MRDAYNEALAAWKNSKAAKDLNGDGQIDYLDLGIARHGETLAALKVLGVAQDKVIFLGYPDGGLRKRYGTIPYKSEFTGVNAVPYDFAYRKGAPYTDEAVVEDLTKIIRQLNPKTVYYTTPTEEHDDHAMTSELVSRALKRVGGKRKRLEYLVHWEHHVPAWPGSGAAWMQPAGHVAADVSSDLKDLGMSRDLKMQAIKLYATQMAVEGNYLLGFAKDSEIFWQSRGSVSDYLK
jgi:LmbE family N-acetylglucosaminyl deacetylase